MQVDLVASKSGTTFVVDCKHWKRTVGSGTMLRVAKKQALRARRMASQGLFQRIVPIVVTWRDEAVFVLDNGVPIVPIHRLADFVLNWEHTESSILVLESELHQSLLQGSG